MCDGIGGDGIGMKILFDHQIFSYQTYGGISRYFFELMKAFARHDAVEFELALKYSDNEYLRMLERHEARDVSRWLGRSSAIRWLARYLLNRRVSRRCVERGAYDVFHPTFFDPYFLGAIGKRPFVLTLLDMTPEVFPELFPRRGIYSKLVTSRWIDSKKILAQQAAKVIAISEHTKQDAVRFYGLDPSRVVVVHLAGSLDPASAMPCARLDLEKPYLLFVGVRTGYKNFDRFVRAVVPILREQTDLQVVCVGGGAFTPGERDLFDALRVHDRFAQAGVSDGELAGLYQGARAFVFPSLYEGFGIPLLEAFACRCPCVISEASCFPEIAADAAAYFDPASEVSMTGAIFKVISDETRRAELVSRGLERARSFSWARTAQETIRVYQDVLARGV